MIQRIQSLYIVSYIAIKIFLLYKSYIKKNLLSFLLNGFDLFSIVLIIILAISIILLASFKNRKNQIKILYFLILIQFMILTSVSVLAFEEVNALKFLLNYQTLLYLLGFALLLLALKGIKKDQNLIDSIDRIR